MRTEPRAHLRPDGGVVVGEPNPGDIVFGARVPGRKGLTIQHAVALAAEIARGTGGGGAGCEVTFVVGSPGKVLARSEPFGQDPLRGHPGRRKQLARLRGVFVVSEDGVALSAARRLGAPPGPPGGSSGSSFRWSARLAAAAHVTRCTDAAAVVVSEDFVVRIFDGGRLVHEVAAVAAEEVGAPASPASRGRAYRGGGRGRLRGEGRVVILAAVLALVAVAVAIAVAPRLLR